MARRISNKRPALPLWADPKAMHSLLAELFPICRSLTGDGVRRTLEILRRHVPIKVREVPSGTRVLDWVVPKEWNIRAAHIHDSAGRKVVDFRDCNLHVVGYSVPVDKWMTLDELSPHLHTIKEKPDAIPYVTSYYRENWGFCLTERQRRGLKRGRYRVVIDSDLKKGSLTYGEYLVPGRTKKEILISTYVCHPSMANNELSGPVVAAALAAWAAAEPREHTFRFVWVPETIGAIVYLSRHLKALKRRVEAGFVLSCLGDERGYSFVSSRYGDTLADRVASHVLTLRHPGFKKYSFLWRGSDERQYCSPGVDLPVVTLCRSKFVEFPEYHTSLDDLSLVTPEGLRGGFEYARECVEAVEGNAVYRLRTKGEPQLGRRGLYPSLSTSAAWASMQGMMDLMAYADGTNDLIGIGDLIGRSVGELKPLVEVLKKARLLFECRGTARDRTAPMGVRGA